MPEKITAETSKASVKTAKGLSPLDWGDKCFLCQNTIGESDPRGFYQGKKAMLLSHRGCLDQMAMVGGTPRAFYEWKEKRKQAPVHDTPVHQDIVSERAMVQETAPKPWNGPRSIQFDSFTDLQTFIVARGAIPSTVRVAIGSYVLQGGGG